jgi:flagellar biosynthesis/type III secretory pathway protein FliH
MKSLPETPSSISSGQYEPWNPVDLDLAPVVWTTGTQKEQFLKVFKANDVSAATPNAPERSSALYRGGTGQDFSTWQPGAMDAQPSVVRKAEWTFLETAGAFSQSAVEPAPFELVELGAPVPPAQPDPEQAVSRLLEQARLQAEELILAAQAEADQILWQAQEEIDLQKKEGYQQGQADCRQELETALQATRALVTAVETWKTGLISQGEQILVEMLKEMAQKMFGDGVELETQALQLNLNRILESAEGLGDLNIFLNPRDAKSLDPSWSEYQMLISGDRVTIIPSGKITRGGCFVKGEMGVVDGRVETQLSAILALLAEPPEGSE